MSLHGVILHNNWDGFSPLLYSHYGENTIPFQLKKYLTEYKEKHNFDNHDGHLYYCSHMMAGFISTLEENVHIRIENLAYDSQVLLQNEHEYPNGFDGGCWIVNVSTDNYGETCIDTGSYKLQSDNIVDDDIESNYDDYALYY